MRKNILGFNNYFPLLEKEGEESKSVKAVSEVISLFFKVYMLLASKAPEYKDILTDIVDINEEKDPAKRGKAMEAAINKVAEKIDPKYAGVKEEAIKVSKTIGELFNTVASSEEAKKEAEVINKSIATKLLGYQDILKKSSEDNKVAESRIFNTYEKFVYPLLYEKNTFEDERKDLISQMKSIYAEMQSQQANPTTDALKSRAEDVIKKFDEMTKLLSDDKAWKDMKRKERKEKLASMNAEISDIITKTNDLQKSELTKIGIDKKVAETMAAVLASINSMTEKAKEIDDKMIEDAKAGAAEYKEGDTVKYKKDDGSEATGEITKVEGDKVFFKDSEGKEFSKDKKDIIGKSEGYKEGDKVKYKKDDGSEATGEIIKIEGDKVFFKDAEGKEFSKDKKDIVGKSEEGSETEGKESDIKSGLVDKANIKKDGPNAAKISEFQKNYNALEVGKKISEDGAYGRNTQKAVLLIGKIIKAVTGKAVETDGGKLLSADLQSSIKKMIENKDKIKALVEK